METCQNLYNEGKSVLRRKFTAINAYIKKKRKISNNLTLHLKKVKKQTKPEVSRRKEVIKIRAEINEIETRKDQ